MSLISFSRDKFIPSDEVSLNVRGNYLSVTRGYQVFTFFKTTNNGIPVFLEDHVDRILGNAQALKMNLPFSKQDVITLVYQTLEKIMTCLLSAQQQATESTVNDQKNADRCTSARRNTGCIAQRKQDRRV